MSAEPLARADELSAAASQPSDAPWPQKSDDYLLQLSPAFAAAPDARAVPSLWGHGDYDASDRKFVAPFPSPLPAVRTQRPSGLGDPAQAPQMTPLQAFVCVGAAAHLDAATGAGGAAANAVVMPLPVSAMATAVGSDVCRRRGLPPRSLPPEATAVLRAWLTAPEHVNHPYPSKEEKAALAAAAGITERQVSVWFTNTRKRIWRPHLRADWAGGSATAGAIATAADSSTMCGWHDACPDLDGCGEPSLAVHGSGGWSIDGRDGVAAMCFTPSSTPSSAAPAPVWGRSYSAPLCGGSSDATAENSGQSAGSTPAASNSPANDDLRHEEYGHDRDHLLLAGATTDYHHSHLDSNTSAPDHHGSGDTSDDRRRHGDAAGDDWTDGEKIAERRAALAAQRLHLLAMLQDVEAREAELQQRLYYHHSSSRPRSR